VESIGEKMRMAREARRLSQKEVAKETNIVLKYIEALEDEDFEKFPSETYAMGFLRSYAEYLKLDADEMIQYYKAYKIGESATPLEELTRPTRTPVMMTVQSLYNQYRNYVIIAGGVVGAIIVIMLFRSIFLSNINVDKSDSIKSIKDEYSLSKHNLGIDNIRTLQLANDSGIILLYGNEAVQFMVDNKEVLLILKELKKEKVFVEVLPGERDETLEMERGLSLKLPEIRREIIFTLKGLTENRAKIQIALGQKGEVEKDSADGEKTADTTTVVAQNKKNLKITFEAEFLQNTYIELYLDGVDKRKGFVEAGTREKWEAASMQVKLGNAGGVRARVNGRDINFGNPGEVVNKVITWEGDINNPNLYRVVVKDGK